MTTNNNSAMSDPPTTLRECIGMIIDEALLQTMRVEHTANDPSRLIHETTAKIIEAVAARDLSVLIVREPIAYMEMKRRYVRFMMQHFDGNKTKIAKAAKVDRKTLYRLLERFGIHG